jgi:hypothetical protein
MNCINSFFDFCPTDRILFILSMIGTIAIGFYVGYNYARRTLWRRKNNDG